MITGETKNKVNSIWDTIFISQSGNLGLPFCL